MKNKKGQQVSNVPSKLLFWTLTGIVWSLTALFLLIIILKYKATVNYFPPEVEDSLLAYRFLYAPDCIAYQDETGRTYAGIIDWNKFTQQQLNLCYAVSQGGEARAFKLVLKRPGAESKTLRTNNWRGSADRTMTKMVVIKEGEILEAGELQFFIKG